MRLSAVSSLPNAAKQFGTIAAVVLLLVALNATIIALGGRAGSFIVDEVALINQSGQLRMLSQRTAKALLLYETSRPDSARAANALSELRSTVAKLDQALKAFAAAGSLPAFERSLTAALVGRLDALWKPRRAALEPLMDGVPSDAELEAALTLNVDSALLETADQLSAELERHAANEAARLKQIYVAGTSAVALLSLVIFVAALYRRRRAVQARARERLRERRLREIIDAHDGVAVTRWRPDSTLLLVNRQFADYLGKQQHELIGTQWLTSTSQHHPLRRFIRGLVNNPRRAVREEALITGDGQTRWLRWTYTPVFDDAGELVEFQSVGVDITERRYSEQRLSANERLFRGIFERSGLGIVLSDRYGYIDRANPAFLDMLGYSLEEMTQLRLDQYTHPADVEQELAMLLEMKAGMFQSFKLQKRFRTKSGDEVWAHVTVSTIDNGGGGGGGGDGGKIIAIVENVTESRRLEAERQRLQRQLIDTSRRAGQAEIATGVLHNVGNVLNSLNVSLNVARKLVRALRVDGLLKAADRLGGAEAADAGKIAAYLRTLGEHLGSQRQSLSDELSSMSDNVGHIKNIVSRQQEYARGGSLKEPFDLASVVDEVLSVHIGERHGIVVERNYAPLGPILADKHRLMQILVNLCNNAKQAVSANDGDKRVRVVLERAEDGRIALNVSDNGVGIAGDALEKVFSYGFTTKSDGHGFGLHASVNAAKEMGGKLLCHSDGLGHGATFRLELPNTAAGAGAEAA